jgi:hypothetical protein
MTAPSRGAIRPFAESDTALDAEDDAYVPTPATPRQRKCLRCSDMFESQWAGERVCGRCKRSSSWRSGEPTAPPATRGR